MRQFTVLQDRMFWWAMLFFAPNKYRKSQTCWIEVFHLK